MCVTCKCNSLTIMSSILEVPAGAVDEPNSVNVEVAPAVTGDG